MTKLHHLNRIILSLLLVGFVLLGLSQNIKGHITNTYGKPLAFATIKLGDTKQGIIANLDGNFSIVYQKHIMSIEISYSGYMAKKIYIDSTTTDLTIMLNLAPNELAEVVVASKGSKVKRILNKVVANKDLHNPDKYDHYSCNIYYKMIGDIKLADTLRRLRDTTITIKKVRERMATKHLFISETKSVRHWKKPQQLQEEVVASRMSGLKTPLFTSFITDVLPFHAYSNFIKLNGKDYNSPLSNGLFQRFDFKLKDEVLQGEDTLWMIDFTPKKNQEGLKGTLYIHSNGYAVKNFIAYASDSTLNRELGVEQQYTFINGKWFPQQLNYVNSLTIGDTSKTTFYMKGTSFIDSVKWQEEKPHRFQKAYTVKILKGAESKSDSDWSNIRPVPLNVKESRTYVFMDSLGDKYKIDRFLKYAEKLPEGKYPIGNFDINIGRIISFNKYENTRLGFGLQTNEKISRSFSVGGWAGYGTSDKAFKYGGFAEIYLDRFKDQTIRFAYSKDIKDPGRLEINKEIDNDYARRFLLSRVDAIEAYEVSIQNRVGYFTTQITGSYQKITPQYAYNLNTAGKLYNNFTNYEANLEVRYAFAERRIPSFNKYYSTGTSYPILYGRINTGRITEADITYVQALAGVSWKRHINKLGTTKLLLIGGLSESNKTLPISKLFAGNGFSRRNFSVNYFGGMQTMLPYEYYTDKFVNFYWQHDFDFRLYSLKLNKRGLSSIPSIGIGFNALWGSMKDRQAQQLVDFKVPDNAYTETGLLLNRILRARFMRINYISLNTGYYYHLNPEKGIANNGRFVLGINMEW